MIALLACLTLNQEPDYVAKVQQFRAERASALMVEEGWFSVAGLNWLEEGKNTFGSNPKNNIVYPLQDMPAEAGWFVRKGNEIEITFNLNTNGKVDGESVTTHKIVTDLQSTSENPMSRIEVGSVIMRVIQRGKRFGIRMYDPNKAIRKAFKSLNWFPIDKKWAIEANYTAYEKPRKMPITNILGDTDLVENPGYVTFKYGGKSHRLEAQSSGDSLFFNFKDQTNGKQTYGGGRFLSTDLPKDGRVRLDFNYAVNPPCDYTQFATCPLPPKANFLKLAIPAGEKSYSRH